MNDSESLKKSHSKKSNAKLTFLCVMTVIFTSVFWIILGYFAKEGFSTIPALILVVVIILVLFFINRLGKFTR